IEILGLVGHQGAGPHDLLRMARSGRMLAWAGESQYYTEPKRLAKLGYLSARKEAGHTRERTVYALTDEGRQELYDWLRELVAQPQEEYPHFGVALSLLSVLSPIEAVELLGRRLTALTAEADEIRATVRSATEAGVAWVFLVEEEYRLAVLDAECRFVTGLVESLKQPDYVRAWQEIFGRGT
ncbi:MAG: hypothetical protein QOE54_5336, partial [Streptosporangiaceae bacterium]|nr:hypothetical protein [Streptosporangiaceae bacterium]